MEESTIESAVDVYRQYIGQKVAVLACRYQYRGFLSKVLKDCVVLTNATSVEVSGPSMGNQPSTEDIIGSTIVISLDAIELFYQPNWVNAPLPGE